MEIVDKIKKCNNDEELNKLTRKLIKTALNKSRKMNKYKGLIGTKSEINQKEFDFDSNKTERISISVPFWNGYIPLNTKIVYAIACGKGINYDTNFGYYYYVDDDSYIYDFIKYIKEWEINDCFDIISLINKFSRDLFEKYIDPKDRFQIHRLLVKNDNTFFEPVKEHSIKDFYGNGSAQCTEYALIANNLLNVLGIETYYCMDYDHAFNVFFVPVKDKKEEYDGYLLDYSDSVYAYDEKNNYIGRYPFYEIIDPEEKKYFVLMDGSLIELKSEKTKEQIEKEEHFYEDFVNNGRRIKTKDFFVVKINNHLYKKILEEERNYGIENSKIEDKKILVKGKKNRRSV